MFSANTIYCCVILLKYSAVCVADLLFEAPLYPVYFSYFTLTVLGELCKSHGMLCGVDELISVLK